MQTMTEHILEYAERLPEGVLVAAKSLLHLGNRATVDQGEHTAVALITDDG